jgi:hypothetical protein
LKFKMEQKEKIFLLRSLDVRLISIQAFIRGFLQGCQTFDSVLNGPSVRRLEAFGL